MLEMVNEIKDPELKRVYIEKLLQVNKKEKEAKKPIKLL